MAPGAHEEQRSGAGPQRKAVDGCPEALRNTNTVQSGGMLIWCRFVTAGERRRARGRARERGERSTERTESRASPMDWRSSDWPSQALQILKPSQSLVSKSMANRILPYKLSY